MKEPHILAHLGLGLMTKYSVLRFTVEGASRSGWQLGKESILKPNNTWSDRESTHFLIVDGLSSSLETEDRDFLENRKSD